MNSTNDIFKRKVENTLPLNIEGEEVQYMWYKVGAYQILCTFRQLSGEQISSATGLQ
jgi:hypothetical protein